jgi:ribosomal protein L20A (L18A)
MPYKTFQNWLFDGDRKSKIPPPKFDKDGKIIVPDILKYNSPITPEYILTMFLKTPTINRFLNIYFNNIGVRYISKEELFKFIKKCVFDFKLRRENVVYIPYYREKDQLFKVLRDKIKTLKNHDIKLLCNLINESDNKDEIYKTLGVTKVKKQKIKIQKNKKIEEKISVDELLNRFFKIEKTG